MRRKYVATAAVIVLFMMCPRAKAGVYTDDLTKCLVSHATAADRLVLMRWVFGTLTLNPALQPMSAVTPEQRETYTKNVAMLFQRLTLVDCRKEAVAGLKYEGAQSLNVAWQFLGRIAARSMFSDPHVAQGMSMLRKFVDKSTISELYKEAGVPLPDALSAPPAQ